MKIDLCRVAGWLLLIATMVSAAAAQTPGNPVIADRTADPHVAVFGGKYYIYPSTYGPNGEDSGGFAAWSSSDLRTWKAEGKVLDFKRDAPWAKSRAWAPAIIERNGKYYFYFSADDRIGVGVSDSPLGPFKDPLGRPLVPYEPDLSTIDPMAFIDTDGQAYLYWGAVPARWLQGKVSPIYTHLFVRKLNPDMISFAGERLPTIEATIEGPHIEGSFVFKRNGIYYLMYSAGNWGAADGPAVYRALYATARSPLGPWTVAENNPFLSSARSIQVIGPGHNSVLQVPGRDDYYVVYHAHKGDKFRQVFINRLEFNPDNTIEFVQPTLAGVEPAPLSLSLTVANGASFTAGSRVMLNAELLRNKSEISKVEFFANEKKIGEAHRAPYNFVWQPVTAGFYRVTARATGTTTTVSSALNIDVQPKVSGARRTRP